MEKKKRLHHGTFNWHGQTMEVYRYAYSTTHFLFLASIELAERIKTSPRAVRQHFDGTYDNYTVERIKKGIKEFPGGL